MILPFDNRACVFSSRVPCAPPYAIQPAYRPSSWYIFAKMATDAVVSLALLLLTCPLLLLMMALVKLTSRGPVLYTQERVGYLGRPYTIYKIRTMFHDCERYSGPRWSTGDADPRVTPIGRWLRRSHLDELPQLWNVLRGEMSLVGPRPERQVFVKQLERAIPNYRNRLQVRPGITGLAQVQLPPDEHLKGVRRKVACDLVYVACIGPWLDLRIILGTALKLIGVSFETTRQMLRLPGVESQGSETGLPIPDQEKIATQMQSI